MSTSPFAARRDAQTASPVVNREPISPELVLVDPVLAERARLVERAQLDSLKRARSEPTVDIAMLRRAVESPTATPDPASPPGGSGGSVQWVRERLMAVVLMLSLLANGVLLAVRLNGNPVSQAAPVALRSVSSAPAPRASAGAGTLGTKGVVERKVVMRLLQSSAGRLPPQLTDRTTGLLKNGVQVVCHGLKAAGAFLCAVRVPGQTPPQAVYLRYRTQPDGRATLTWSHGWQRTRTRDLHQ